MYKVGVLDIQASNLKVIYQKKKYHKIWCFIVKLIMLFCMTLQNPENLINMHQGLFLYVLE